MLPSFDDEMTKKYLKSRPKILSEPIKKVESLAVAVHTIDIRVQNVVVGQQFETCRIRMKAMITAGKRKFSE
jgi:hypothetical protein